MGTDQAVLELTDPPASASWVLGLKVCVTTSGWNSRFLVLDRVSLGSAGCPGINKLVVSGVKQPIEPVGK